MEAYYAAIVSPPTKATMRVDKLTYEIFSLLESKFLFGPGTLARALIDGGRVRVLVINDFGGAGAEDALARLEATLRNHTGDRDARVANFFDLAAGASVGGVLAAMLFLWGADGRPRYTADDALAFVSGRSVVDGATAIAAASGEVAAMGNLAAAAITHVLHNKQELPLAAGVEDLLVLSISAGASTATVVCYDGSSTPMATCSPSPWELARVTTEGVAGIVDESVAMVGAL